MTAIVAVDIGTSATKTIAFDLGGHKLAESEVPNPTIAGVHGEAEQDPSAVFGGVVRTIAACLHQLAPGQDVACLSFSSAMHGLMAVDRAGRALSPLLTWADSRAWPQVARLRATDGHLAARTGTPLHPMAPIAKLLWLRENQPDLFKAAGYWVGIKEYVLGHMTGTVVVDHSIASGTGLLDIERLTWYEPALELAGIGHSRLPPLVKTTSQLPLTAAMRRTLGLGDVPIVVGAGDGPLANLGTGAVHPGEGACSIGTSGALRVLVNEPWVERGEGSFCYLATEGLWVVGGATSNGGIVLEWAREALGSPPTDPLEALTSLASEAPPGSLGLVMLPYLLAERAPSWSAGPAAAFLGLKRVHGRSHMLRAALEGVCYQLALVLRTVASPHMAVTRLRGTGSFLRSGFTRQLLTDVLGLPMDFTPASEGSAFGAALLAMRSLGAIASFNDVSGLVPVEASLTPDGLVSSQYQAALAGFGSLVAALEPAQRVIQAMDACFTTASPARSTWGSGH